MRMTSGLWRLIGLTSTDPTSSSWTSACRSSTASRPRASSPRQADLPAVLVLTTFEADELVLRAIQAGAAGFLLKHTPPAEIVRAIELVHAGEGMLSPAVTRRLIPHGRRRHRRRRPHRASPRPDWRRSARASATSPSPSAAARPTPRSPRRCTSPSRPSKADVSRLLDKLEVDNRVQIALLVQAAGKHLDS